MTTSQRDGLQSPTTGQTIFNIDQQCLNTYNGTTWLSMCGTQIVNNETIDSIKDPTYGQLIYNTTNQNYEYYDSITNSWQSIAVPAMTTVQRDAITKPNNGQTIFNTDQKCLNTYYDGSWISQCGTQILNSTQIDTISNPTPGQIVYNTTNQSYEYYDSITHTWQSIAVPGMTTNQRDGLQSPTTGQTIFNIDQQCLNTYNGMTWLSMCGTQIVNNETIDSIKNPSNGQLVYNTTNQNYEYYDSITNSWQSIAVPAMTTAQRDAITKPNNGQTIFNTDQKCLNTYYDGSWISQCGIQVVNNETIDSIKRPGNGQIVFNTNNQNYEYYDSISGVWRSLVVPAMDSARRDSIANPVAGQTIFNTSIQCLDTYNGTAWVSQCGVQILSSDKIDSIKNPSDGQLVYNTTNQNYEYYDSITNSWQSIAVPAMTTAQRDAITKPNNGQTIFNTDQKCLNTFYSGTWISQCGTQVVNNKTIDSIKRPGNGQIVFNTDNQNFEYYDSTSGVWRSLVVPAMDSSKRDSITTPLVGETVFNTDEDCLNTFDGTKWISLCGVVPIPMAVFGIDSCGSIANNGTYVKGTALNSSNYLSLSVNVTKAGTYMIQATTTNGYAFTTQGTFVVTGEQTITIPGQGKPIAVNITPGDPVTLQFNGTASTVCNSFTIPVVAPIAAYSISCATEQVNGTYVKGTQLTASNTITMSVNVSDISNGGSWTITTNTMDGISFSGSGTFTAVGTQLVTLVGSGTPNVNTDIPINITANTVSGNATCSVTVPITLPAMTYAVIGTGIYSWASPQRQSALANNSTSFSLTGVVPIQSFTQLWSTSTVNTAAGYLTNGYNGKKPDVVLYFAYGATLNATIIAALANYVNAGGVLIFGITDGDVTNTTTLLNVIFGSTWSGTVVGTGTIDNDYLINNLSADPIINGPFGDLAGRYWGEENAGTLYVTSLPANSVQVCPANNLYGTANLSPDYSVVWYNNSKNFVYFGDSGGTMTGTTFNSLDYTSAYTTTGAPLAKMYGLWSSGTYGTAANANGSVYVYNSALELNCVSWAVRKAAISGINPH
jgi:hypothetical protein